MKGQNMSTITIDNKNYELDSLCAGEKIR